jgi:hypothetical protein
MGMIKEGEVNMALVHQLDQPSKNFDPFGIPSLTEAPLVPRRFSLQQHR